MKCQKCFMEIEEGAAFCGYCGAPQIYKKEEEPVMAVPPENVDTVVKKKRGNDGPIITSLLFLMFLFMNFMPDFLETILFALTKKPLSKITVFLCGALGLVLAMLFLCQAIYLSFAKSDVDKNSGLRVYKLHYILGIFPFLFFTLVSKYLFGYYGMIVAAMMPDKKMMVYGLIAIAVAVLAILMGISFSGYVSGCRVYRKRHAILNYFLFFFLSIPMSVMLFLSVSSLSILEYLEKHYLGMESLMIRFSTYVISAMISLILMAGVFKLIHIILGKKKTDPEMNKNLSILHYVPCVAALILCVVLIGIFRIAPIVKTPLGRLSAEMGEYAVGYSERLLVFDMDGAVSVANRARDVMDMYLAAVGKNDGYSMEDTVKSNMHDAELLYIDAVTNGSTEKMESYLRVKADKADPDMAICLLDVYAGLDSLSDIQKDYQSEALRICAQNGLYENPYVNPKKLIKKAEAMKEVFKKCAVFEEDGEALSLYVRYKENNDNGKEIIDEVMEAAENYPDNMMTQYIAGMIGSSLTYDDATHYEKTAAALLKYKELYEQEYSPDEEEQQELNLEIAQKLMNVYQYEDAVSCLSSLDQTDENVAKMLCECYQNLGQDEEAYKVAKNYNDSKGDSPYLLYYGSLCALKSGNTDDAIALASSLATYVASCKEDDLNECDSYLYNLLNYMALSDNANWTDYQYKIYDKLTEAQNKKIDENPFFRNYIDAVAGAYDHIDETQLNGLISKIDAVLNENPNLASAWYLKGTIYANTEMDEHMTDAVEAFKKAGELNPDIPAVWYAMAKVYDRMGDYKSGITACEKALALLPEQDHGEDWYGINIHCKNLLEKLLEAENQ